MLADPRRHLLIAEADGEPVGQVRFDARDDERYEISVGLAAERRGAGLGVELIRAGCEWLWSSTEATSVVARVKPENSRSSGAFAAAGFRDRGVASEGMLGFELRRPDGG